MQAHQQDTRAMDMDDEATPCEVSLKDLHVLMRDNPLISRHSTYSQIRRSLVNWIADVCKDLGLRPQTVHCATSFMDRYMHNSHLSQQYRLAKYHTYAAAAVLIAAKLQEHADRVPLISELVDSQSTKVLPKDVSQAEIQILLSLGWRTSACTCLHFLDIHLSQGVCSQGDPSSRRIITPKDQQSLVKYLYFFADLCLLEAEFSLYSTALTSAAIIAAARETVRIDPIWTKQLQTATGFCLGELTPCLDLIKSEFCRTWPDSAPDHLQRTPRVSFDGESSGSRASTSSSSMALDSESTISSESVGHSDVHSRTRMRKRIVSTLNSEAEDEFWNNGLSEMEISSWEAPPKVPARKSNLKTGQLLRL